MLDLLIMVIFGTAFAYFATQNTSGVDVRVAGYMWSQVPLYIIVLGSMIVGLILAALLHYIDSLFTFFQFQRKDSQIRASAKTVEGMNARIKDLEVENARLRGDKVEMSTEERIHEKTYHPSLFDKLRQRFT